MCCLAVISERLLTGHHFSFSCTKLCHHSALHHTCPSLFIWRTCQLPQKQKTLSYHVPAQNGLALHILQAELAHVEPPQAGVFLWVWRVVPGVQLVAAKHDGLYHVAAFWHLACQTKLLLFMPGQEGKGDGDGRKGTTRTGRQGRRAGRGERGENGKISVSQGWGSAEHRTSVEATMH